MEQFPKLKTGAGAQYPLRQATRYATHVTQFLDGAEQRFRCYKQPERRWTMTFATLDEMEARKLRLFFEQQSGEQGAFEFENPVTVVAEQSCHFAGDSLRVVQTNEDAHSVSVTLGSKG